MIDVELIDAVIDLLKSYDVEEFGHGAEIVNQLYEVLAQLDGTP